MYTGWRLSLCNTISKTINADQEPWRSTMLKDMDFGVYGKGIDGYIHHSLAMDRIQEEEENRKALMDEFDNDEDNFDSDDLDFDDFGSDDFDSDDFGGDDF